jgi:hypothetical protein
LVRVRFAPLGCIDLEPFDSADCAEPVLRREPPYRQIKLYDRTKERLTLDEVERIRL